MQKDDKIIGNAAKKANIDIIEFKKAAEQGKAQDFIDKNLSKEASEKIKKILNDKSATEKLLSTPQAKELMNKILGKK